ncbi:restriction endonuclease [Candidatus Kaiserbacteria bacterium GWA2_50_9]|uniref:type II site-specific deoxyribonuclease n=1 Tax=Candidatus Kaiserbacteria bacterium GWA2_50_9 TaxID=1798474 RepID=A0A1F6BRW4_9BACT|nr:MAG: restriction endonuclease [Candidatus Kaiserbacteria bacterium GWA2_50_9]
MALSKKQVNSIEEVLKASLRNKFQNYKPEPASMPFHTRLLGKDRLALYSFIHSLNTNFGTSIFEPVGLALAQKNFKTASAQAIVGEHISSEAQIAIQKIIDGLTTANTNPDKEKEIEIIRKVCQQGVMIKVKLTRIDLMMESKDGGYFLFDIKTAKPNAGGFKEFKRTLLEWTAAFLANNPKAKVNTLIAIPYNPYEPEPYNRWTMRGMLDLDKELKVASEFWDFLAGKDTYKDLLDCFERVGIELRGEIDDYFKRFNKI